MEHRRQQLAIKIKQQQTIYNAEVQQFVNSTFLSPLALLSRIEVSHEEHLKKVKKLILTGA